MENNNVAPCSFQDVLLTVFEDIDRKYTNQTHAIPGGILTGFRDLDNILICLRPSSLNILASRPSMGKTTLGLNIISHSIIRENKTVLLLNLAETKEEIVLRLVSSEAGINRHKIESGGLTNEDWKRLSRGLGLFSDKSALLINDEPLFRIKDIVNYIRHTCSEYHIDLIVIDYLQLSNGNDAYFGNRTQELSDITRSLKQLAMELKKPILVLSQLSRNVEARCVKKPLLSDLRDSGSAEDDADVVMFLYRDDYYNPDSDKMGIAEIIVAKNRFGPTGSVDLFFHKEFGRFITIDLA